MFNNLKTIFAKIFNSMKTNKIISFFFSNQLMAVLFVVFPTAMGIATFIENDYNTQTARALVYNTWWFEAILFLFVVNFIGNIFKYRLYDKKKWVVLSFHLAFVLILVGAAVTRYIGYEGLMPIKEGEQTATFLSDESYLEITIDNNKEQRTVKDNIILSSKGTHELYFFYRF